MWAFILRLSVVSAQDLHDPSLVFAEQLKKDDAVLRTNPAITKAHEAWKAKLEVAAALLTNLNRAQSRENKIFVTVLDNRPENMVDSLRIA